MLKLMIVDDEKIIRETISKLIDWTSLDIELIGTCPDGISAYEMILDEYPDIVLTDIKMPGLSGLELIEKVHPLYQHTEFIVLSGFSDFSYAKTAMKFGVKHYLLKPCNENQIIEVMKEATADVVGRKKALIVEKENQKLALDLAKLQEKNAFIEDILYHLNTSVILQSDEQGLPAYIKKHFSETTDLELAKSLASHLISRLATECNALEQLEMTTFLHTIYLETSPLALSTLVEKYLHTLRGYQSNCKYKDFIEKVLIYVDEHLEDPTLSLKGIAENYLYMNVDYVSKQFVKQTGDKFSIYLTRKRIEKAKKLLLQAETDKIYLVAEQVGCGNNPQYFSQIFKKYTGVTPSAYIKEHL